MIRGKYLWNAGRLLTLLVGYSLLPGCAVAIVGGVTAGTVAVNNQRTLGATVEDQQIESSARKLARTNKAVAEGNHLNFISYNRVLLITGEVRKESTKAQLDNIMRTIPNLRRIHNELTVAAPSSALSRTSDTYLTAKVKTRLLIEKQLNANHFKVVSENGRVYLLGLCSRKEGAQAALVARKTSGVQSVTTLFEYIN